MALGAVGREVERRVTWRGGLKFFRVTAVAVRRHGRELADRPVFVTGVAIHRRMCAQQREAIVVLLDLLDLHIPALHRMALLAGRPENAPVDVSVTVRASSSNIAKHRLGMTLSAGDCLV